MKLLVAVDFSDSSEKVLEKAKEVARAVSGKIFLLHVAEPEPAFIGYEPGPQSVRDARAKEYHEEHKRIQDIADAFIAEGFEAKALMIQGPTVETIVKEAKKLEVDMIVVGSHGHSGLHNLLLGSVSEGVLHHASCPVLLVPARPTE